MNVTAIHARFRVLKVGELCFRVEFRGVFQAVEWRLSVLVIVYLKWVNF